MLKACLLATSLCLWAGHALAASDGFGYDFHEPVIINGHWASKDTPVHFGDAVLTGKGGRITIKLDGNVFRLGQYSRLTLPAHEENITLNFFFGSLLAVFRHHDHKQIITKTAVLGVRGTGAYLDVGKEETYLCTCYGDIDFADASNLGNVARVHAHHHNAIAFDHGSKNFFTMQPLIGHATPQLVALEALADRLPPETCSPENNKFNTVEFGLPR